MESDIKGLDEALEESMVHLVQIMRHALGNIHEEKNAIIDGRTQDLHTILLKRAAILDEVTMRREKMCSLLAQFLNGPSDASLDELAAIVGSDKVTILSLRDQIVALADTIERENARPARFHAAQLAPSMKAMPKPLARAVLDVDEGTDQDLG